MAFLLPGVRFKRTVSRFNHLQIGQLGRALRSYRFRLKLRQIDVAKMIGVDAFTIVNWERGKTEPESRHIPRLTELLGKDHQPRAHTIWTKLKRFRKSLGLTQAEFATLIQANESSVWRWEQGRGIIPKRVLRMMGKPVIFHAPKTRISLTQLNAWKTRWEAEN